ncbi:MAG: RsbRD N-terminal domain-containing protein [Bacillota bacterium]
MEDLVLQRKNLILQKWFQQLLETYPQETARFLLKEKDQFANPVGHSIYEGMKGLLEQLINGPDKEKLYASIEQMIKIRAVQEYSPSQAIGFVFMLKKVIREELAAEIRQVSCQDLLAFDSKIDEIGLLSFDIYAECRERVCQIRIDEMKNRTQRVVQRINMLVGYAGDEPEQDL